MKLDNITKTEQRKQITNLDSIPFYDRSLVDYEKYQQYISHAGVKYSMSVHATRGCPYRCFYCDVYKTTLHHFRRSVENVFEEVKLIASMGIKRIEFIDDIFNVKAKDFKAFFKLVLKHKLKLNFYFPTALKGDLLDKEGIDLMVEAGATGVNISLESASPRLQTVMRKYLNIDKFYQNARYITEKYPNVILGVNAMHGFPTETEKEAMQTLDFFKSLKWIHFPYFVTVRAFPNTELEKFALEQGISKEIIRKSADLSYEDVAPSMNFTQEFTRGIKAVFLKDYVLNKERLLSVLPHQMKSFCADELNQKYNDYFPRKIKTIDDVLKLARIDKSELKVQKCLDEKEIIIHNMNERIKEKFPAKKKDDKAMKVLFMNMAAYFSEDTDSQERVLLEPPLGLIALLTYLNNQFKEKIDGKIMKSRLDFDGYQEMVNMINDYKPDLICISVMSFYKNFVHRAIKFIRDQGIETPFFIGGPYPTGDYENVLKDENIDVCILGEGEVTLTELVGSMMNNGYKLPSENELKQIPGIAFRTKQIPRTTLYNKKNSADQITL